MLDNLESYLASWTGRSEWPSTPAILESHPTGLSTDSSGRGYAPTFSIFTYEVGGEVYAAVVREVAGHQKRIVRLAKTVTIQYDPDNPKRFYYAPSCQLASRLILWVVVIATLVAIGLCVYFAQQPRPMT